MAQHQLNLRLHELIQDDKITELDQFKKKLVRIYSR